jgi:hypothetical protein
MGGGEPLPVLAGGPEETTAAEPIPGTLLYTF